MQAELKIFHETLNMTFIYVTHDQEEALTMSDTVVVMNQGEILQQGTPIDIYNEPANAFVADFIGESNIIPGIMKQDKVIEFLGTVYDCVDTGFEKNEPVDLVIRPEDIVLLEKFRKHSAGGLFQASAVSCRHDAAARLIIMTSSCACLTRRLESYAQGLSLLPMPAGGADSLATSDPGV